MHHFYHFDCSLIIILPLFISFLFFFNDTATTEIYTLSLHDALPICISNRGMPAPPACISTSISLSSSSPARSFLRKVSLDRKSTRLNSSHQIISYAVFCLKKKKDFSDRDIYDLFNVCVSI